VARPKKPDIKKNTFLVRVGDDDTLTLLDALFKSGLFASRNELINRCLDAGAAQLHRTVFTSKGKKLAAPLALPDTSNPFDIGRALKQIEHTTDDMFVVAHIMEDLLTTLFNVEYAKLSGEPVAADDMLSGRLAQLPQKLQSVKAEIIRAKMYREGKQ